MMKLRAAGWAATGAAWIFCGTVQAQDAATQNAGAEKAAKIRFEKTHIETVFRSEGVAVGDFNKDGKLDIAAGSVWFEAPEWKRHSILEAPMEYNPLRYSESFCNFADDVDGDGWTDLIVVGFPSKDTFWYKNPGKAGGPWKAHSALAVTNNESPTYLDVDGDGKRELVAGNSPDAKDFDGPQRRMIVARPGKDPTQPWVIQQISTPNAPGAKRYEHGLGVGDVDGDGKNDVLVAQGWWKNPGTKDGQEWTFSPAKLGSACAQMHVFDFNGDGRNDVLSSSAHGFGIWWHERTEDGWRQHEIDKSYSQTHALAMADLDEDGLPDFITGKRWWAHGPKGDPGSDGPAVLYWHRLTRTADGPKWTPYKIDDNSGVGTQFEVVDVSGDGLLDIVVSNKQGTFYFRQVRHE